MRAGHNGVPRPRFFVPVMLNSAKGLWFLEGHPGPPNLPGFPFLMTAAPSPLPLRKPGFVETIRIEVLRIRVNQKR